MNVREAIWFARAIRLWGVKELFDVLLYVVNWLLQYRTSVILDAQRQSHPHRELLWACLSLLIGIVLLRYAPQIASALVGRRTSGRISNALTPGTNTWLSIGVRCMAFGALVRSISYLVGGFLTAVTENRLGVDLLGWDSFHYFAWGSVYATVGVVFSMRPDIIGIFIPAKEASTGGRSPDDDHSEARPHTAARF